MTSLHRLRRLLRQVLTDRTGATVIEYALMVAFLALAIVSSLGSIGERNATLIEGPTGTLDRD